MYLIYMNCSVQLLIFRLHALSLRRALRRQRKKKKKKGGSFVLKAFVRWWKSPSTFCMSNTGEQQNEHTECWLKFTDLQNSLSSSSSSSSSPRPLGLEVAAAYHKRARSFINVRFSIQPAFWRSLTPDEYFLSEGGGKKKKKKHPST